MKSEWIARKEVSLDLDERMKMPGCNQRGAGTTGYEVLSLS